MATEKKHGINGGGGGVVIVQVNCNFFPVKSKSGPESHGNPQPNDKKAELPVTTVTLKMPCQCRRCLKKFYNAVMLDKGVNGDAITISIDNEKGLMKVEGKVDVKQLVERISKKLKISVEIVPEKKNQEEDSNGCAGKVCNNVIDGYGYGYANGYGYGYGPNGMCQPDFLSDENPNACSIM